MTINKEDKKLERRKIGRRKEELEGGSGRWTWSSHIVQMNESFKKYAKYYF